MESQFGHKDQELPIPFDNMTQDEYENIAQERRNGEWADIKDFEYITNEEIIRLILNSGLLSEESLQEIAEAGIISYNPVDGTISYPPNE